LNECGEKVNAWLDRWNAGLETKTWPNPSESQFMRKKYHPKFVNLVKSKKNFSTPMLPPEKYRR
jgi:hypothetical protein